MRPAMADHEKNRSGRAWLARVAISLWFGLLALPFTGWKGSLRISASVLAGIVLFQYGLPWFTALSQKLGHWTNRADQVAPARLRFFLKLAGAGVLLLLPLALNNYQIDILTMAGLYAVLALGLNIVVGFAGLLDLGYAGFYAVGAYTCAILTARYAVPFWLALPAGGVLAAAFGMALGVITLRLRGDYLAIVTLGFIQILHLILNNWDSVTNGPRGIMGIPHPALGTYRLAQPIDYYYLMAAIFFITWFVVRKINATRIGRAWVAIREDELAAGSMGLNTTMLKVFAFVLGAFWAGIGGAFFAGKFGFISPESFTFFESVLILSMVVLGGLGSIPGVILGALALIVLPELLRGLSDYRMLIFGLAMILMMILRPEGLIGSTRRKIEISSAK